MLRLLLALAVIFF